MKKNLGDYCMKTLHKKKCPVCNSTRTDLIIKGNLKIFSCRKCGYRNENGN